MQVPNLVDFICWEVSREHAAFVIALRSEVGCLLLAMLFSFFLLVEKQFTKL